MNFFEVYVGDDLQAFFKTELSSSKDLSEINCFLKETCGVINFFQSEEEIIILKESLSLKKTVLNDPKRREYGDYQTNDDLAAEVLRKITDEGFKPAFLLEPTCGKGAFIIASLKNFNSIKKIIGVEIFLPYIWETKFRILECHLNNTALCKPDIEIVHSDIFDFSFKELSIECVNDQLLIIGNPPWVTNSELGSLDSSNLPVKSNFKKHNGFDAMTGKGNFDLGEYICLQLFKQFEKNNGKFAFLVKNAVVKNIVFDQKKSLHRIANLKKYNIDAKKEFNVSVNACLFLADLNTSPSHTCQEINFYSGVSERIFGWHKEKFVYSIELYNKVENIDGNSNFIWRQGVKHDCSKVMEFEKLNGQFINKLKQEVKIEKDLQYGLLKSSDLKADIITRYRKSTIITQKRIGQDTSYISKYYPLTYDYLMYNKAHFDKRKSSIYKGKPPFSIFGIGDYSFAPFKIGISGMYKKTTFSLILPEGDKPLMLDDTCYFIGFENIKEAIITQFLLNSFIVQDFLAAVIFPESKRSITKDILMRIDLSKVIQKIDKTNLDHPLTKITIDDWKVFEQKYYSVNNTDKQLKLF